MAYEVFLRTTFKVGEPTLTLAGGKIRFNSAAARIFTEAGIRSVLLLWDRANSKFALKAALKGDINAYKVSITPDRSGGTLTAKSFLSHIGWNAPRRVMLPAAWNKKEKILEISLPQKYMSLGVHGARKERTKPPRRESGELSAGKRIYD